MLQLVSLRCKLSRHDKACNMGEDVMLSAPHDEEVCFRRYLLRVSHTHGSTCAASGALLAASRYPAVAPCIELHIRFTISRIALCSVRLLDAAN